MASFNEKIKKIPLSEVLIVIVLSYILVLALDIFRIVSIDINIINLIIVLFFAIKLKDYPGELKSDVSNIFSVISFKEILVVVLLNILFSYGMLYLSNYIIGFVPKDSFLSFLIPAKSIGYGMVGISPLITIIFISPIAEELLFRGVFLNKFRLVVPMVLSILISSLLFASLHSFGSIFSAFVFGICMAILYLKTDNIFVPIFAHFINNLMSEVIYFFDFFDLLFTDTIVMVLMSSLAIISFIVIFKFIRLNLKNI